MKPLAEGTFVRRHYPEANLAERVELRSALAQYRAQASRGNTHTEELQRTLVTELEGARAAAERANAVTDKLHFERERTAGPRGWVGGGIQYCTVLGVLVLSIIFFCFFRLSRFKPSRARRLFRLSRFKRFNPAKFVRLVPHYEDVRYGEARLEDAAEEAKRGEIAAKRQAKRMQEHMVGVCVGVGVAGWSRPARQHLRSC